MFKFSQYAISTNPDDPFPFYFHAGQAALMMGKIKEAILYFKEALNVQPNNLDALYQLAQIFESAGQKQLAVQFKERISYLKSIKMFSTFQEEALYPQVL